MLLCERWHMKKIITALLLITFCAAFTHAQDRPVTGNEWLKVDKNARVQLVASFIQDMKKQGVVISKDAVFYCKKLDLVYAKKPNLLTEPVWKVLKTDIIMEYDWRVEGKDSDAIAKEWLSEKLYDKNKERRAQQGKR